MRTLLSLGRLRGHYHVPMFASVDLPYGVQLRPIREDDAPALAFLGMALMMTVYISSGPHTVRGLAEALHVSKPVITRALNKLSALGYLRRERDAADRRNIFITRTPKGAEFLDAFHHFIAGTGRDERHDFSSAERTA